MREAVVDELVHALAVGEIALRLHGPKIALPLAAPRTRRRRKRLGADDRLAEDMGHRRDHARHARAAVVLLAAPELAHRHVAEIAVLEVVRRTVPVRLEIELESVLPALRLQRARIVLAEQRRDDAPEVVQELLRLRRIADHIPDQDRQERTNRVSRPLLELPLKSLRPVLAADLIAVNKGARQARTMITRKIAKRTAELANVGFEVEVKRRPRQLVDLEAATETGGRMVLLAVRLVANAKELPVLSGRGGPLQRAVRLDLRAQVDNRILRYCRTDRRIGRIRFLVPQHERLALESGDHRTVQKRELSDCARLDGTGNLLRREGEPPVPRRKRLFERDVLDRRDDDRVDRERQHDLAALRPALAVFGRLHGHERAMLSDPIGRLDLHGKRSRVERRVQRELEGVVRRIVRVNRQLLASFRQHALRADIGNRHHGDVTVESVRVLRKRQSAAKGRAALHGRLGRRHDFHRVGRRIPRSARARPAAAVWDDDLEPEPPRLRAREADVLVPRGRVESDRSRRDLASRVEKVYAAESRLGNRLQIGGDALLGDVPVHPMPPRLRPRLPRRIEESLLQRLREHTSR